MPVPSPSPGLLTRWLSDPDAFNAAVLQAFRHALTSAIGSLLPIAAAVTVLLLAGLVASEVAAAHQRRRGRWVAIAPPGEPDPAGGEALWRMLAPLLASPGGLLRSRLPVAFECSGGASGLRIGLWVPPRVSLAGVLRAIESAWPGVGFAVTASPDLPAGRRLAFKARLAASDWLPLGGNGPAAGDPIRGVLGSLGVHEGGGAALLQVLARPARRRLVARAHRAARALRRGQPTTGLGRMLDPFHAGSPSERGSASTDPLALADVRAITAKAVAAPHFEVALRYAVASEPGASRRLGRRTRRARARQIAVGLGLYAGRNHLVVRRRLRPTTARALRRGFLCSLPELAALAHLPAEPASFGLPAAPARSVAPPPGVARG